MLVYLTVGGSMYFIKKTVFLILLIVILISCGDKKNERGIDFKLDINPKIISTNFSTTLTLTDRLFVNLKFEYKLNKKYKKTKTKYMVYVHFNKKNKKSPVFQYNHSFKELNIKPVPKWEKGDIIRYTKKIYISKFLDNYGINFDGYEMFNLIIGLYNPQVPNDKIVLYNKDIRLEAEESHAPAIGYMRGWYEAEYNLDVKDVDLRKSRWTSERAECIIDNGNYKSKKHNYTLIVKGRVSKNILKNQRVFIRINDMEIDSFIPKIDSFKKKYSITPQQIGNARTFKLIFETDKTFVPSEINPKSKDKRKLGIMIYSIYFRKAL